MKALSISLIVLGVLFFVVYLWWGYSHMDDRYAVGIWLVAVGTFISGLIGFTNHEGTKAK